MSVVHVTVAVVFVMPLTCTLLITAGGGLGVVTVKSAEVLGCE